MSDDHDDIIMVGPTTDPAKADEYARQVKFDHTYQGDCFYSYEKLLKAYEIGREQGIAHERERSRVLVELLERAIPHLDAIITLGGDWEDEDLSDIQNLLATYREVKK
jgi:hypothetical protein